MPKSAHAKASQIDSFIRSGRSAEARTLVRKLAHSKLKRDEVAGIAVLARRLDLPLLALRLLNPIVRGRNRKGPASAEEQIEYAACLTRIGASAEAISILTPVDKQRYPRADLFLGFAAVTRRDYAQAISHYSSYVRNPGIDPYSRMVGQTNLADALLSEGKHLGAERILKHLLRKSSRKEYHLIQAKALELSAQSFIFQNKLEQAEAVLARAEEIGRNWEGRDAFYIRKWKSILALLSQKGSASSLKLLHAIREEAGSLGLWETARTCDGFEAIARRDETLLVYVYFGTPIEKFRQQLLRDFGKPVALPFSYLWNLHGAGERPETIDLTCPSGPTIEGLKIGQLPHRLIALLSSDFYQGMRLATIHSSLYPGDFFNPHTSPGRIHNAMKRLRDWFQASSFPIEVEFKNGFYRLTAKAPCAIRVAREELSTDRSSHYLTTLRENFPATPFSSSDTAKALGIEPRSANRFLAKAVQEKSLLRQGTGRLTRYVFSPPIRK